MPRDTDALKHKKYRRLLHSIGSFVAHPFVKKGDFSLSWFVEKATYLWTVIHDRYQNGEITFEDLLMAEYPVKLFLLIPPCVSTSWERKYMGSRDPRFFQTLGIEQDTDFQEPCMFFADGVRKWSKEKKIAAGKMLGWKYPAYNQAFDDMDENRVLPRPEEKLYNFLDLIEKAGHCGVRDVGVAPPGIKNEAMLEVYEYSVGGKTVHVSRDVYNAAEAARNIKEVRDLCNEVYGEMARIPFSYFLGTRKGMKDSFPFLSNVEGLQIFRAPFWESEESE